MRDRDEVIVILFEEAEHDHARAEMFMSLRDALGYGHNMGEYEYENRVDWPEAVRSLLARERAESQ